MHRRDEAHNGPRSQRLSRDVKWTRGRGSSAIAGDVRPRRPPVPRPHWSKGGRGTLRSRR
jgi:hypothetical protein